MSEDDVIDDSEDRDHTPELVNGLSIKKITRQQGSLPAECYDKLFLTAWCRTVSEYSGLAIKYESDRLLAFSSIARIAKSALGCPYSHGILQDYLPAGLLWEPIDRPMIAQHCRAPSWSWVACGGAVDCPEIMNNSSCITFHDLISATKNSTTLCLKGQIITCYISSEDMLR